MHYDHRPHTDSLDLYLLDVETQTVAIALESEPWEESLQQSEVDFRRLAESLPQLAWMARPNGDLFWWNGRWRDYTGTRPGRRQDWGWHALHDPDERSKLVEGWGRAIQRGERFELVMPIRGADGRFRSFLTRVEPSRDGQGRILLWFGTSTDIEDQTQAERSIRVRAEQLQNLAAISTRINEAHNVDSVIAVVTEEARVLIAANQAATSMVLDPKSPQSVHAVSRSKHDPRAKPGTGPEGLFLHELVSTTNQTFRLTQAALLADQRWHDYTKTQGLNPAANGLLAAPLIGRNGRNMGLIELSDKREGEFTQDDESLLLQLALIASVAVENARLYEELRDNDRRKESSGRHPQRRGARDPDLSAGGRRLVDAGHRPADATPGSSDRRPSGRVSHLARQD